MGPNHGTGPGRSPSEPNFPLPPWLTLSTGIEALILLAAALMLFCFPLWEGRRWPWELTPYNTVFLGGIYWAAVAVLTVQLLVRRWAPARIVQPLVLTFSLVLLLVSLGYGEQFDWQRRLVKAWFGVYTLVPLGSALAVWSYRDRHPATPVERPQRARTVLRIKAFILGGYAMGLLVWPSLTTAFWPWPINAFHARLYSAIFLATALGNGLLSRSAAAVELLVLGLAELLLGALPLWGVVNLDRVVGAIDWSLPGGWLWLALLGGWAIAGADLIRQAFRWRRQWDENWHGVQ